MLQRNIISKASGFFLSFWRVKAYLNEGILTSDHSGVICDDFWINPDKKTFETGKNAIYEEKYVNAKKKKKKKTIKYEEIDRK
jgi:hypothetical protein